MRLTEKAIEMVVANHNKWLENHPKTHFSYNKKAQHRDYYIKKLCEMDEQGVNSIEV